ncbi:MAG: ROK family protein [Clostridia bacterium]|nr:ROK family protein [Clostridia bacterium]
MKILAFDIGGTAVKYAVTDESFDITHTDEFPSDAALGGAHIISAVCRKAAEFKDVDLIAVSTAGQVDPETGVIIYANENIPGYTGFEVKKTLEEYTGKRTYVENDAVCALIAEAVFGAGRGQEKFLCLTYGTGVGGCLFCDGEVYRGNALNTGEIGHIITHFGGLRCGCGGHGCYEAYASCTALVKSCEDILGREINARKIFSPESFGIPAVKEKVDLWIDEIVFGIAGLIQVMNVNYFVLGGGVMNEDYVQDEVRNRVNAACREKFGEITVKRAAFSNFAGVCGAAYSAYKKYTEGKE